LGHNRGMAKAPKTRPTVAATATAPPLAFSGGLRLLLSLLIGFHVLSLFVAPWSSPPPSSQLSQSVADQFRWYSNATHTQNGYRFFAPAPGPSHLVEFDLTLNDGTKKSGRFPDLNEQWPRLYYHRYFMLSEHLNNMLNLTPSEMPADLSPEMRAAFQKDRALFHKFVEAYANQLLREYDAKHVKLRLVEHRFPSLTEALVKGWELDDKRLYGYVDLGEFPQLPDK